MFYLTLDPDVPIKYREFLKNGVIMKAFKTLVLPLILLNPLYGQVQAEYFSQTLKYSDNDETHNTQPSNTFVHHPENQPRLVEIYDPESGLTRTHYLTPMLFDQNGNPSGYFEPNNPKKQYFFDNESGAIVLHKGDNQNDEGDGVVEETPRVPVETLTVIRPRGIEIAPITVPTIDPNLLNRTIPTINPNNLSGTTPPSNNEELGDKVITDKTPLGLIPCNGAIGEKELKTERAAPAEQPFLFNAGFAPEKQLVSEKNTELVQGDLLLECEKEGTESWSKFSSNLRSKSSDLTVWDASWKKAYQQVALNFDDREAHFSNEEKNFWYMCKDVKRGSHPKIVAFEKKIKESLVPALEKVVAHREKLERCEALAYAMADANYDREYSTSSKSNKTIKSSADGKIQCETYGPEAQDFKQCSAFIDTYDAAMVAKIALGSGQNIHYQGQNMDRQSELARQGATGGIDHRGALGAQKEEIKDRAGYATQTATLDSAKLATLFGILQSMPNRPKLAEECNGLFDSSKQKDAQERHSVAYFKVFNNLQKELGTQFVIDQMTALSPRLPLTKDADKTFFVMSQDNSDLCKSVVYANGAETLIMNDKMRSDAKQVLATTAIEAASSFAAAGMLNNQAKQIDDLLKRIDGYDPSDDFTPPNTDLMAGPCAFDPSAPGCLGSVPGATRQVGFGNTTLSLGGTNFGTSGNSLDGDTGYNNAAGSGVTSSDRSGAVDPVGAIIPNADKSTEFVDPTVAAARSKSTGAPQGRGGGGGGASAVGSTGGGGGAGANGQQAKGGQATGGKQLAYSGGSIGRLSGGRGVGRKPAAKEEGANPFANMFKKGGPANETLNFRGPAGIGAKQGNIFDQISNRYQVVQGKSRLLEYQRKD